MFGLLASGLTVPVLLVSVVLLPALGGEVGEEGVVGVRVGVRLVVVVPGRRGHGGRLVVMMMELVFALLVPLFAARPLLGFQR